MANSKQLKTGNSSAAKPGKGERYAITQETHDAAFAAGQAYAGAYHAAALALQPLLAPLSGLRTAEAVEQWTHIAIAFREGMAEARAIDADSARKAFNRLVEYLGLEKPQTAQAAAKQAARKAAKPETDGEETVKDGAGEEAAKGVQMVLSAMEAHVIAMLRAAKYSQAAQAVADMAEAAK